MILMCLVHPSIPSGVFIAECQAKTAVPHVVTPDVLCPFCARVPDVCHLPKGLKVLAHVITKPYHKIALLEPRWRLEHPLPSEPVSR